MIITGAKFTIVQKRLIKTPLIVSSKTAVKFKKDIWKKYLMKIKDKK